MFYWSVFTKYSFYHKPDGEAIMEKIMSSMAVPVGYSITHEFAKAYFGIPYQGNTWVPFGKAIKTAVPLCGIALFFTVGTHAAARVRDKDDPFNHVIGSLATTPLVRYLLSLRSTIHLVTLLAISTMAIKYHMLENEGEEGIFETYITKPGYYTPVNADNWILDKPRDVPFIKSK